MVVLASWPARFDWLAHLGKAMFQSHHGELDPVLGPYIPKDAVVFDVGAHAGQMAKLFARLAPTGKVYAFEPGSYALSVLRPGIWASGFSQIEIVPLGLSDAPGTAILHMPVKKHGGYGFGLSNLSADNSGQTVADEVKLTTLDAFVAERGLERLDFIKVDVEGWEAQFLKGAMASVARFRPVIMMEVVADFLARAGTAPSDIFGPLSALGYSARHMVTGRVSREFEQDGDYLFLPDGRA
jgi:FkbM family methyltransferase